MLITRRNREKSFRVSLQSSIHVSRCSRSYTFMYFKLVSVHRLAISGMFFSEWTHVIDDIEKQIECSQIALNLKAAAALWNGDPPIFSVSKCAVW